MQIYPAVDFSLVNGFLLMIPLLGLRFGIPAGMRKTALAELEFFPPVRGFEQIALKVYFVTNTFLIFSPLFANIQSGTYFSLVGWLIYILGLVLMTISLINYCTQEGLKRKGIYCFSRNPMCIGYFLLIKSSSPLKSMADQLLSDADRLSRKVMATLSQLHSSFNLEATIL